MLDLHPSLKTHIYHMYIYIYRIYPWNQEVPRRCLHSQWNRPGALGWRLEKFNVDDGTQSTHDVREESCRSVLHTNALVFIWLGILPIYFDSTSNKHAFLSIYRSIYLSIWYCFKVFASCIFQWCNFLATFALRFETSKSCVSTLAMLCLWHLDRNESFFLLPCSLLEEL